MKVERLWLQKQCVLLARHNNGSPLDWLNVPLWQLDGWIEVTNELNEKRGGGMMPWRKSSIPLTLF